MRANPQKTVIASAISLAIGSVVCVPALADSVTQLKIEDVGSNSVNAAGAYSSLTDGISGAFRFNSKPMNVQSYAGASLFTGDVGTGAILAAPQANPTGSFSTGFIFSSAPFVPYTFAGGMVGDIDIDSVGGLSLNLTSFDFGGNFGGGTSFNLPPDTGTLEVLWVVAQGSGGGGNGTDFDVAFRWGHDITTAEDPSLNFSAFTAQWVLEGVVTVTDSAPKIFPIDANGTTVTVSGDITVQAPEGAPYNDTGAVCQDVVDGDITGNVTTTPANPDRGDAGLEGDSFTVVYDCQDSATNSAVSVTKTVDVVASNDTTPPAITLTPFGAPVDGDGRDDPDAATVNLLQGVAYVDAGATCFDAFDGNIDSNIVVTGAVDTAVPGAYTLDFDCDDAAGNSATTLTRTVNVIADNVPPVVTLLGANPQAVAVGGEYNDQGATCTDTNPVDVAPVDITGTNLNTNPTNIPTGNIGTFTVNYDCADAAGNAATQQTRTVQVSAGVNYRILSMTISDVDGDGVAGCFKFANLSLDPATLCNGANRFSSDGSGDEGSPSAPRIPGVGEEKDSNGDPIGMVFGKFQPISGTRPTPPGLPVNPAVSTISTSPISPGFVFASFPFVPITFNPSETVGSLNREVATVPFGFVTVVDEATDSAILTIPSLPFGGLYRTTGDNFFFLDPDPGTDTFTIEAFNDDDDGTTRTFHYTATWDHLILPEEDSSGQFNNFDAFWRLEGIITVDSADPLIINAKPRVDTISASQDGLDPTSVVVSDGGLVTVTVSAQDPDGNNLVYDWSQNAVNVVGATDQASFTFDPAGLAAGGLGLVVTVSDDAAEPLSTLGEIVLRVEASAPALSSTQDSNRNGMSDADEGYGDDDGDGIPNYQDVVDGTVDPGRNSVDFRDPAAGEIVSTAGRLRLGRIAAAIGDGAFIISEADIASFGGPGATPTNNSGDRLDRVGNVGPVPNGIRDFIIDGLAIGATVQIVIPQNTPLPSVPQYRKYTPETGWVPFNPLSGNALASAPKVNGICPDPSDPAYDAPVDVADNTFLVEGDECVRLTLVDGGSNDADGTRNGIIVDPGTVSSDGTAASATSSKGGVFGSSGGGCSLSSNTSAQPVRGDWWMLLAGVLGLFGFNRSRNTAARSQRKQ